MNAARAVVVLAGGEGRRMGGDKPLMPWGQTTLIGRAVAQARAFGGEIAVAVRDPRQVAGAVDTLLLVDAADIQGPLAGLASALMFARDIGAVDVLTLPCDAPRLPLDLAQRLALDLRGGAKVAIAQSAGRLHPTCALWRTAALNVLPRYIASDQRSLKGFAATLGMACVEWSAEEGDPFANANTPEELAGLQVGWPATSRAAWTNASLGSI